MSKSAAHLIKKVSESKVGQERINYPRIKNVQTCHYFFIANVLVVGFCWQTNRYDKPFIQTLNTLLIYKYSPERGSGGVKDAEGIRI